LTASDAEPTASAGAHSPRPSHGAHGCGAPRQPALLVTGPITRADVPGLCERLRTALGRTDTDPLPCDVAAITDPNPAVLDALARLQLTARRLDRRIRLTGASGELALLLALTGLDRVLPVEARGQSEHGKQPSGVQERIEPDDPAL
jgi:ABC-type transporter Mla MlaB component